MVWYVIWFMFRHLYSANFVAQADTDPAHGGYPQLALNGDTDSFSLCPTQTTVGAQVNVVYKATLNNYGQYIYAQCYPVKLYMLEQY